MWLEVEYHFNGPQHTPRDVLGTCIPVPTQGGRGRRPGGVVSGPSVGVDLTGPERNLVRGDRDRKDEREG